MKVLLIEDEQHKTDDLKQCLFRQGVAESNLSVVASVRHAVLAVSESKFDLIVLDMALPTFSSEAGTKSGGGAAQAAGGIEILRALEVAGARSNIVIVTQYHDIILNGSRIRMQNAPKLLSDKYGQNVLGAVIYSYKSPEWETNFTRIVERMK